MRISARAAVIRKRRTVLVTAKPWEVVVFTHAGQLVFWTSTRERAIEVIEVFS